MPFSALESFLATKGIQLSASQIQQFETFQATLLEVNAHTNLTRVAAQEIELRHFIDSLLIVDLFGQVEEVLDIGCGPGFPAWPLAAARSDLTVTALDSAAKMIGFLKQVPLLNLIPIQGRAEDVGWREAFDIVTGRALAPLLVQLELSAAPARVGGRVIPFRTPLDRELIESSPVARFGLVLESIEERALPGTDIVRLFPVYRKTKPTLPEFPRPWAKIKAGSLPK